MSRPFGTLRSRRCARAGRDRTFLTSAARILIECIRPSAIAGILFLAACGNDGRPARLGGAGEPSAGSSGSGGSDPGGIAGASGAGGSATASAGAAGSGGTGGTGGEPSEESCIPRLSCQRLCSAFGADPSSCGLGNAAQCGCVCEERLNGPCPEELDALLACAGDAPNIDCTTRGRIVPGCENESFALEACDFQAREQLCAGSYPACTPYCRAARLGFCPLGPESVASCLCGCEASLVSTCATQFDAFMSCTTQAPAFACDDTGRPAATTCPSEWQSLASCMAGVGVADAGG